MIITEPEIQELVQALEQVVHKSGWDEPPRLMVAAVFGDRGACMPFPLQPHEVNGNAVTAVGMMADTLAGAGERLADVIPGAANVTGLVLITEMWTAVPEVMARHPDVPRLADMVGAKEARVVAAVDCAGRKYGVSRIRGEEPNAAYDLAGQGVVELARLLKVLTASAPADAVDRPALNTLIKREREFADEHARG